MKEASIDVPGNLDRLDHRHLPPVSSWLAPTVRRWKSISLDIRDDALALTPLGTRRELDGARLVVGDALVATLLARALLLDVIHLIPLGIAP